MTIDYSFLEILKKEEMTQEDAVDFAKNMENAVNSFGFPKQRVCELILDDDNSVKHFLDICLTWIDNLEKREKWQYDGRNEASVKLARELRSGVEKPFKPTPSTEPFIKEAEQWHRTLQQTFSGLVFLFLDEVTAPYQEYIWYFRKLGILKNLDEIKEKYGENWFSMPLV